MSSFHDDSRCGQSEITCAYALEALPESEMRAAEAHIARCADCRRELESLGPLVKRFVAWPTDILRPDASLQARLAERIGEQSGRAALRPNARRRPEPEWQQVAPGIECKLLANDAERSRASMLVRLAPGASYPAHRHADTEELHLLDGELWIGDRRLVPGDYSFGPPGTMDWRVWSETGCTCVLVTSTNDALF